jgi:hypothetical protein
VRGAAFPQLLMSKFVCGGFRIWSGVNTGGGRGAGAADIEAVADSGIRTAAAPGAVAIGTVVRVSFIGPAVAVAGGRDASRGGVAIFPALVV